MFIGNHLSFSEDNKEKENKQQRVCCLLGDHISFLMKEIAERKEIGNKIKEE